jgi:hypothetical protein
MSQEETNTKIMTLPNKYFIDDFGIVYGFQKQTETFWILRGLKAFKDGIEYKKSKGWFEGNRYLKKSNIGIVTNKLFLTLGDENND